MQDDHSFAAKSKPTATDFTHKFHCTVCDKDFILAGGGLNDIARHKETKGYVEKEREKDSKYFYLFLILG